MWACESLLWKSLGYDGLLWDVWTVRERRSADDTSKPAVRLDGTFGMSHTLEAQCRNTRLSSKDQFWYH